MLLETMFRSLTIVTGFSLNIFTLSDNMLVLKNTFTSPVSQRSLCINLMSIQEDEGLIFKPLFDIHTKSTNKNFLKCDCVNINIDYKTLLDFNGIACIIDRLHFAQT